MSGLAGWIAILLLAPGLLVVIGVVVAFVVKRNDTGAEHDAEAAGYYHVLGVDQVTGARREKTIIADSRGEAAEMAKQEGIVVMEIRRVDR